MGDIDPRLIIDFQSGFGKAEHEDEDGTVSM